MRITTDPICQACKQPLAGKPATFAPAPSNGGTWYLHCDIRDCLHALRQARGVVTRVADARPGMRGGR